MNTENLKQLLEALNNATVQAKEAFYVYLAYQLLDTVIVASCIVLVIVFLTKKIFNYVNNHDKLAELFWKVRAKQGKPRWGWRIWDHEVDEAIENLGE